MRINVTQNLSAADASQNETGVAIPINQVFSISAQVIVTGSSTGSLQLQVSNDPQQGLQVDSKGNFIPNNWSNLGSAVTVTTAGVQLVPQTQVCYSWLRAVWTKNNGSAGTITVNIASQGV